MDAIISVDERQQIVVFNSAAEQMFRCPAANAIGTSLDRFIPQKYRGVHAGHVANFGKTGATSRSMRSPGTLTALRVTGEEFPIEATISQVTLPNGKLYTVILRDISERKEVEERLRASEAKFRAAFEYAAVGMGRVRFSDGTWIDANDALCQMVGYTAEEMRFTPWMKITHPDDLDIDFVPFRKMAAGELNSYSVEKRFIHKRGDIVWARLTLSLVRDAEGKPDYEVAVVEDISESKAAEIELQASEEELQYALSAARAGSWSIEIGCDRFTLGPESQRLLFMSANPTLEEACERIFPEYHQRIRRELEACIRGERDYALEFRVKSPEGQVRWVEARGRRIEKDGKLWVYGINHDITDRKQAEEARRKSESRYLSSFEVTGLLAWGTDAHGNVVEDCPTWRKFTGQSYEQIKGAGWIDAVHPEDVDRAREVWGRAVKERTRYEVEYRVRRFDGGYRSFLVQGTPLFEEDGTIREWAGTCTDITERKQVEQSILEKARLLDLSSDAIFVRDAQDRLTYWNRGAELLYGYTQDEVLGRTPRELLRTEFPTPVEEIVSTLHRDGVWAGEVTHTCKNGARVMVSTRWVLDRHAGRILATNTDITNRRLAEQALQESEQRFRAVAENIPQMIWVADRETNFYYLSPKWLQYTGTNREMNGNGGWAEALHPEDRESARKAWEVAVKTGGTYQTEYRVRRFDGEYRWHLVRAVPMHDPQAARTLWFGTTTDIQDQMRAQEALIRSEKLASVGRMAATVAHEINNPLELVMNLVYIATLDQTLQPRTLEALNTAEQELERVAHLTRQTLGFYRENTAPSDVEVTALVRDVVQMYNPKLIQREMDVIFEAEQKLQVHGIAGEIRQVVSNLVSNAIDASPPGGKLLVRTSSVPLNGSRAVRITLADTGEGIRPENLQRIFEPFFTTKESVGTGLGLWVSSEIVERHHGRLRVRSRRGEGTVFSIFLPETQHPK